MSVKLKTLHYFTFLITKKKQNVENFGLLNIFHTVFNICKKNTLQLKTHVKQYNFTKNHLLFNELQVKKVYKNVFFCIKSKIFAKCCKFLQGHFFGSDV